MCISIHGSMNMMSMRANCKNNRDGNEYEKLINVPANVRDINNYNVTNAFKN